MKRPNKTTPSTSQTTPNKPAQDKTVQPNKPAAPKQQESKPNNTHTELRLIITQPLLV